ncbi:DUF4890 domain-containing protein [Cecembia lonarensis]|uniref:DUF4890 domain-containing protein n=1 Tax=Cecembia lonarensis (strain CCUG 58316 / KCTC 22772 / LW9) TaxID=1225176 RepID=K1L108_CECL9|nr:DUF4890 domain-containing protein [Cecembia lonarensis]EKB48461.1 hypothetical protein B879_02925 [Cecembia lonarensis LW9]
MKKILLIVVMFSLSLGVFAQRGGGPREMPKPEQRAERMTNRMAEQLELTDEQKDRIYHINLKNAQERQAEMDARRAEADQRREGRRVQMQEQIKEVESILNPEQAEKWAEMRESNRQRGEYGPQGPRGHRGTEMRKGKGPHVEGSSQKGKQKQVRNRSKKSTDK